ncbi:MAG: response regulator [Rubrivivax sp.]|nr:response regulator [Rubrivivax sp.]
MPMTHLHHRIALLGFSAFERNTLASYFRLASTREPRYDLVSALADADFVVADADHGPSVQVVLAGERLPETVFVGARAPQGAIAWMARPIDPLRVLRELDVLAARRLPPPAGRRPGHASAAGLPAEAANRRRTVIQPARPQRPEPPAHLLLPAEEPLDLMLPDLQEAPPARGSAPSTALLVDDSDIALRFLQKKLVPFGLLTHTATHSDAALERLARQRYDFVFLDMELGDASPLDGLGLCQLIKRETAEANVVMVTAHHTELDRVRGALAGCDGFLGKPLDDEELALYLARHGVRPAANAGRAPS